MDDGSIISSVVTCSSCDGKGYSGFGSQITQCYSCGGNGKVTNYSTFDTMKDETLEKVISELKEGNTSSFYNEFVNALLNETDFIDLLLDKVGHKIGEQDDDD